MKQLIPQELSKTMFLVDDYGIPMIVSKSSSTQTTCTLKMSVMESILQDFVQRNPERPAQYYSHKKLKLPVKFMSRTTYVHGHIVATADGWVTVDLRKYNLRLLSEHTKNWSNSYGFMASINIELSIDEARDILDTWERHQKQARKHGTEYEEWVVEDEEAEKQRARSEEAAYRMLKEAELAELDTYQCSVKR